MCACVVLVSQSLWVMCISKYVHHLSKLRAYVYALFWYSGHSSKTMGCWYFGVVQDTIAIFYTWTHIHTHRGPHGHIKEPIELYVYRHLLPHFRWSSISFYIYTKKEKRSEWSTVVITMFAEAIFILISLFIICLRRMSGVNRLNGVIVTLQCVWRSTPHNEPLIFSLSFLWALIIGLLCFEFLEIRVLKTFATLYYMHAHCIDSIICHQGARDWPNILAAMW